MFLSTSNHIFSAFSLFPFPLVSSYSESYPPSPAETLHPANFHSFWHFPTGPVNQIDIRIGKHSQKITCFKKAFFPTNDSEGNIETRTLLLNLAGVFGGDQAEKRQVFWVTHPNHLTFEVRNVAKLITDEETGFVPSLELLRWAERKISLRRDLSFNLSVS